MTTAYDPRPLEQLLREAESLADARARRVAADIAAQVLALHRAGLARLLELVRASGPAGTALLSRAASDELVRAILDLHELDARTDAAPCQFCALCAEPLGERHAHLFEVGPRTLACACDACGMLFDSLSPHRYRRVRPLARRLEPATISDQLWSALGVPVGLAFFRATGATSGVIAAYPGPAGAVEAVVAPDAWGHLMEANPSFPPLAPDVEALLVNRLRQAERPACYHLSVDHCYRLAGVVRSRWQGLTGGPQVSAAIDEFFQDLERRA